MRKDKWKRTFKLIAINLVVFLLILSGVELFIHLQISNPNSSIFSLDKRRKYYHEYDQKIVQYQSDIATYNNKLFYKLKPGVSYFENREFSTKFNVNSLGYRDDEISLDNPKIIVLGDSYSMGWGVQQADMYGQKLEKQLNKTVLTTAISSYGTARELETLKEVNLDSLEYLIIQFCPNDVSENHAFVLNDYNLKVSSREIYELACAAHMEKTNYYPFKHFLNFPKMYAKKKPKKIVKTVSKDPEFYPVKEFVSMLKKQNIIPKHVKIILFSLEAEYVNNGFITAVKQEIDKDFTGSLIDQVFYLDLSGKIDSSSRFILDPHLNSKGHSIIANEVEAKINEIEKTYIPIKHWTYPNGDTSVICEYHEGIKDGTMECRWPNGNISMIREYRKGIIIGKDKAFDSLGRSLN